MNFSRSRCTLMWARRLSVEDSSQRDDAGGESSITTQRFDGSGYPDGLRGEQAPLWARIIALTDAYANMVTEQSFSAARTPDQALDELAHMKRNPLRRDAGTCAAARVEIGAPRFLELGRLIRAPQDSAGAPSFSRVLCESMRVLNSCALATASQNPETVLLCPSLFLFSWQSCSHLWRFAWHWRGHGPDVRCGWR